MFQKVYAKIALYPSTVSCEKIREEFFIPLYWQEVSMFQIIFSEQAKKWMDVCCEIEEFSTNLPEGKVEIGYNDFLNQVKNYTIQRKPSIPKEETVTISKQSRIDITELASYLGISHGKVLDEAVAMFKKAIAGKANYTVSLQIDEELNDILQEVADAFQIEREEMADQALTIGLTESLSRRLSPKG